ncbi:MAG: 2-C-methyl-D-erythritol 4-phosphate cytidylyltransferase [Acidimicrobiales bacterium]
MSTWVIVVAGGRGERFGQRKQYETLGGRRVLDWALEAAADQADGVVLVVPHDAADTPEPHATVVVAGGDTRSASVRAGLAAVPAEATQILVHDAARPVPVPEVWARVREALALGADAVVPAVPVADSLRHVAGGPLDRRGIVAVQTPQGFSAHVLRTAHVGEPDGTDDASLVEAAGGKVVLVDGDPANLKLTTSDDLAVAEALCARRSTS